MVITPLDFEFISTLIRGESAIVLDVGKEYLVEARLDPVVKSAGFASLAALVAELRHNGQGELRRKVVAALTTNETSFFRDLEPFNLLRSSVIPELIKKRESSRQLSIWCAAASSGQEPYSLVMMLKEAFPVLGNWQVSVLATDLCREVLERAREGVYTQFEVNRGLPVPYLIKYFEKQGGNWRIKQDLRKIIRFEELNLIKPFSGIFEMDLIMVRNVLIYFDVPTKSAILQKLRGVMRSDGFLFLGSTETTLGVDDHFERYVVGKGVCYRKKAS